MKEIPLTKGFSAIVDDDDYEYLIRWKWTFHSAGYAYRSSRDSDGGSKRNIYMHRVIAKPTEDQEVDHINGVRLDNRRSNLRCCNSQENRRNMGMRKNKKIPFKGVRQGKGRKGYYASIVVKGKTIYLGTHPTPELAGAAYSEASRKYFGEFSRS